MLLLLIASWGISAAVCFGLYRALSSSSIVYPPPKTDILFQVYATYATDQRTLAIGFVDQDGSGKQIGYVLQYRPHLSIVAHAPFVEYPYVGFLSDDRPYVRYGGRLSMYQLPDMKSLPCNELLAWRPHPVSASGAWVGEYQWADDGGALLFWPSKEGCPKEDLWSRAELDAMGVYHVTAYHTQNALLLLGLEAFRWDLKSRKLEPLPWSPCRHGELSPDDRRLACISQENEKVVLQIWDMETQTVWRERLLLKPWIPSYGIDVAWAPDGSALVYHHCVNPDRTSHPLFPSSFSCEDQGADNLGIYLWDLKRDKERLITTGGVFPYWANWNGVDEPQYPNQAP